jgi:hypothetical protein
MGNLCSRLDRIDVTNTGVEVMGKEFIRDIGLCVSLVALFYCAWLALYPQPKSGMVYDCRLAEISPDYPPAIKNECRELMKKHVYASH